MARGRSIGISRQLDEARLLAVPAVKGGRKPYVFL